MRQFFILTVIIFQSAVAFAQQNRLADDFAAVEEKIRKLYDTEVFANGRDKDFDINDICTSDFLKRLSDASDYDGGGYALWLLRSGAQDGDDISSKVLSVDLGPDDTVVVHWTDMGHEGSTTFTMVRSDGVWKIAGATVPEGFPPL